MTTQWQGGSKIFGFSQLTQFLSHVSQRAAEWSLSKSGRCSYYDVPAAFDTETTSMYRPRLHGEPQKVAWVYIWQFGIDDAIIYGRNLDDFKKLISQLNVYLDLGKTKKLVIYVHNLGYDFQFIKEYFKWKKVFSVDNRRPIYANTGGVQFRDSLILSNSNLETVGKNLVKYKVQKLVGDLDYSLIRHSETPLSDKELEYCFNDIKVILSYIKEKIESDGSIANIPLTNTGYVRRYAQAECYDGGNNIKHKYIRMMKELQITLPGEYDLLHRGFMGGFTHTSCLYSNQIVEDVGSIDESSAYPAQMCAEPGFPMSSAHEEDVSQLSLNRFHWLLENKCCLFEITFYKLRMSQEYESPLSSSRCECEGYRQLNNGRIAKAEVCTTVLTELDYDTCVKFYKWDGMFIHRLIWYDRGYLPKQIIMATLNLYEKKTTLKDIDDQVVEYMISKGMLNSVYGMMVTNIIRDEHIYDNEEGWIKREADVNYQLDKYNKGFHRFLFYAWGVWVTALARHKLFSAIYEFKNDYVYCDTDSIKAKNMDKHQEWINDYNHMISAKLLKMCQYYNIPFEKTRPRTKEGVKKPLGIWEREPDYAYFKACGAKRYMYAHKELEAGEPPLSLTVSGLNKKYAVPWLLEKNHGDIGKCFEEFGEGFKVPPGHTGKMTLTYIDERRGGVVKDYLGNWGVYDAPSAVHMEPQGYEMGIMQEYLDFLKGIREVHI